MVHNSSTVETNTYDALGFALTHNIASGKSVNYTQYTKFGELEKMTEGNHNFEYTYDKLGRVTTSKRDNVTKTIAYIPKGQAAAGSVDKVSLSSGEETDYDYDKYGNLTKVTQLAAGRTYVTEYQDYDVQGRYHTLIYPTGVKAEYTYDDKGYLTQVHATPPHGNKTLVWNLVDINAQDQITNYQYGNYISTSVEYDLSNMPKTQILLLEDSYELEKYITNFDVTNGNLTSRSHGRMVPDQAVLQYQHESFTYDAADRLLKCYPTSDKTGNPYLETTYDVRGNITSKSDIGLYNPSSSKLDQVTNISPLNAQYSPTDLLLGYNVLNQISRIQRSTGHEYEIQYAADDVRAKMTYTDGTSSGTLSTTYYAHGMDRVEGASGELIKEITYIEGPTGVVALFIKTTANPQGKLYHLTTDHLGSPSLLFEHSDNAFIPVEKYSFGPWGAARSYDYWGTAATFTSNYLTRGYTGYEYLSSPDLYNANARMYDPSLARFYGIDKYVSDMPGISAYAYALNNPLKYTDPSGEIVWFVAAAVIIAAGALNTGIAAAQGRVHNFGDAIGYFGVGAAAGAVGLFTGGVGGFALAGAIQGGGNSVIAGESAGSVFMNAGIGAIAGVAGGAAGGAVGGGISNAILRGAVQGAVGGAAGGFTGGFLGTLAYGGDFGSALENGFIGAGIGFGVGGAMGAGFAALNQAGEKWSYNRRIIYDSGDAGLTFDGTQADGTMECGYRCLSSISKRNGGRYTWDDFASFDSDASNGILYSKSGRINEFASVGAKGGIGVSKPYSGINASRARILGDGISRGEYSILSTKVSGSNYYHARVLNRVQIRANGRIILRAGDPTGGTSTFRGKFIDTDFFSTW